MLATLELFDTKNTSQQTGFDILSKITKRAKEASKKPEIKKAIVRQGPNFSVWVNGNLTEIG